MYEGKEIMNEAKNYFTNLFTEEEKLRNTLFCNCSYPKIDEETLRRLGGEITNIEIKEAMFNIGAIKSPGPDGLNALFYQSQWEHLGDRKSTRLNSSHSGESRMPSSA